jgi:chromatin segregation and condensation protein Rec8/ScpA/Scc1 (kleisin family)
MKILNIHKTIAPAELHKKLEKQLNPLFKKQRQTEICFVSENKDGAIEISQPDIYEGFLFRIEIKGNELQITRSEHYVDDVNSLTVESILNEIFADLAEDGKVTLVLEG